jgi:hypothetical protein
LAVSSLFVLCVVLFSFFVDSSNPENSFYLLSQPGPMHGRTTMTKKRAGVYRAASRLRGVGVYRARGAVALKINARQKDTESDIGAGEGVVNALVCFYLFFNTLTKCAFLLPFSGSLESGVHLPMSLGATRNNNNAMVHPLGT